MENATKALLIAAAVLIVILLIAFGMRVFNSTKDVSGQATDTGNQIKTSTTSAGTSASASMVYQRIVPYLNKELDSTKYTELRNIITDYNNDQKNAENKINISVVGPSSGTKYKVTISEKYSDGTIKALNVKQYI